MLEAWTGVGVPDYGVYGCWGADQVLGCCHDDRMLAEVRAVVAVLAPALLSLRPADAAH